MEDTTLLATLEFDVLKFPPEVAQFASNGTVRLQVERAPGVPVLVTPYIDERPILMRGPNGKILVYNTTQGSWQDAGLGAHSAAYKAFLRSVADAILFVDPIRDVFSARGVAGPHATNGGQTLQNLHQLFNDQSKISEWTNVRRDLAGWIKILLNEESFVNIDVYPQDMRLTFRRGERDLPVHLRNLGTGVSEFIILLSFLRARKAKPSIVIIEEPEAHLHPGAVVKLMRIVTDELKGNQLFITSHSTAIVDASDDWTIFRVSLDLQGATSAHKMPKIGDRHALLADLGIRPSQLWLANTVVWVEGPSDVIYMRRLLGDVAEDLLEGRDFAFSMYGGALLAHVGIDGSSRPSLVSLFSIALHNVVIADRDGAESDPLKDRVQNLIDESKTVLGESAVFITPCREVENLVRPEVLFHVVTTFAPKKKKNADETWSAVTYEAVEVPPDSSFSKAIADAAKVDGETATTSQAAKIASDISNKKTDIAVSIVTREDVFSAGALLFGKKIAARLRAAHSATLMKT
jgi:predicted ATPase